MALGELASLAEIISAVAIVISLLYLAKQVKTANDMNRIDAFRVMVYGATDHLNLMFSAENVSLTIKGLQDYLSLASDEKLRYEHLMTGLFQHAEDAWNSLNAGIIGPDVKDNWSWFLKEKFFPYRGARDWWAEYKPAFAPDFQAWIDSVESAADHSADPYNIIKSN